MNRFFKNKCPAAVLKEFMDYGEAMVHSLQSSSSRCARFDVLELLLHDVQRGDLLQHVPLCERERNADQGRTKVGLVTFLVSATDVYKWHLI